jgi:hypothetical protein
MLLPVQTNDAGILAALLNEEAPPVDRPKRPDFVRAQSMSDSGSFFVTGIDLKYEPRWIVLNSRRYQERLP